MGIILFICILFSIYSFTQIPRIKFDYNFANLQAQDEGIKLAERVYSHFGVTLTPAAFVAPNRARAIELAKELNDYIKTHPETTLDFAASVMSHVPRKQLEKISLLSQIDSLIEKRGALIPTLDQETQKQIKELRSQLTPKEFGIENLPGGLFQHYENGTKNISVVYVFPRDSILDGQVAKRFIKELRSLSVARDVILAGEPVIYADILILLERDTPRAMALSLFMVILVLFLHFKRPAHVFWVLLPVMTAFLWMVGMAGATNFKFNYLNMAILPSILGAGIDNGIYIYHSYKNKQNQNIFDALGNTGKGVLLASLTAIAAFLSMIFARHAGMASMGKLGFFGFTSCFLTSVIFLPALIQFMESRRKPLHVPEEALEVASSSRSSSLYKT
jgi:predicted RND superfamily exporter protein